MLADRRDERYERFGDADLILRDHLALDRTVLANERTFLAYTRTALTLFAVGVTFAHFFQSLWLEILGWMFVPAGVATFFLGWIRYRTVGKAIDGVVRDTD